MRCVLNLFVLIIVSRENELLCFDYSTKYGDEKLLYVPKGMHCIWQSSLYIPQKFWLQTHNFSLRYSDLKLVDCKCVMYFVFVEKQHDKYFHLKLNSSSMHVW